jgi:CubicO group peptidase (beta-lactamase class C family)
MRWNDTLAAYFQDLAQHDLFSGVVLITRDGSDLFAGAYGYASRAWKVPNTLETRFDTASVTKLFTAIAVLQLIDQGRLAFDTPVLDFLGLESPTISRNRDRPFPATIHYQASQFPARSGLPLL